MFIVLFMWVHLTLYMSGSFGALRCVLYKTYMYVYFWPWRCQGHFVPWRCQGHFVHLSPSWALIWKWLVVKWNGWNFEPQVPYFLPGACQGHLGVIWCTFLKNWAVTQKWIIEKRNGQKFGSHFQCWCIWVSVVYSDGIRALLTLDMSRLFGGHSVHFSKN